MKYSWQKMHAPFLLPSMVDALMISSISGTLNPFSASAILRRRHLHCLSEKYWTSSILLFRRLWKVSQIPIVSINMFKLKVECFPMTIETLSQNFTVMATQPVPVNTQKDPKLNAKKFRENSHRWKSDRRYHRERWRLLSVGSAKALSVRCGD